MIALGTQDNFSFAQEFVTTGNLTDSEVTFLWEPGFSTWQAFDVRINSSMLLFAPDFSTATDTFVGFSDDQQQQILDILPSFEIPT